jgi:hypothetical protein
MQSIRNGATGREAALTYWFQREGDDIMKTFIDLADLAKRVTGADRELDVLIGEAVNLIAYDDFGIRQSLKLSGLEKVVEMADTHQNIWSSVLPRYTASYDAIMTLAGDDNRRIEHGTYENGTGWAYVYLQNEDGESVGEADANSELLALLAAMLTAKSLRILRAEPIGALHA